MKYRKLISFLLLVLLLFTSCVELVPPEEDSEMAAENETTAPSNENNENTDDSDSDETTASPYPWGIPAPKIYPKRTYDREELYRHAFEDQSRRVDADEVDSLAVDCENGQALMSVVFNTDGSAYQITEADSIEYYLVNGMTTAGYDTGCNKYEIELPQTVTFESVFRYGTVKNDYHEAYLNVLFENITFSTCERFPTETDRAFLIGYIDVPTDEASKIRYSIYSDGHLYYKKNGQIYKCDQTVDFPYLNVICLTAYYHKRQCDAALHGGVGTFCNEQIGMDGSYEIKSVTRANETFDLYIDENGRGYRFTDPHWAYWEHLKGFEVGAIGMYMKYTIVFSYSEVADLLDLQQTPMGD